MNRTFLFLVSLCLVFGCQQRQKTASPAAAHNDDPHVETIQRIIDSEATILALAPYLAKIANALAGSSTDSKESVRQYFAAQTNYTHVGNSTSESVDNLMEHLWQPFLGEQEFTECQFGTLAGTFSEDSKRFENFGIF